MNLRLLCSLICTLLFTPLAAAKAAENTLTSIDNSLLSNYELFVPEATKKPMTVFLEEVQQLLNAAHIPIKLEFQGDSGAVPLVDYQNSKIRLHIVLREACESAQCDFVIHGDTVTIYPNKGKKFRALVNVPQGLIDSANDIFTSEDANAVHLETNRGLLSLPIDSIVTYDSAKQQLKLHARASALYHLNDFLEKNSFIDKLDTKTLNLACKGKTLGECLDALQQAMEADFGLVIFNIKVLSSTPISLPDMENKTPRAILKELCKAANCDFNVMPEYREISVFYLNPKLTTKTWQVTLDPLLDGYDIDDENLHQYFRMYRGITPRTSFHYDPQKKELRVHHDSRTHDTVDNTLEYLSKGSSYKRQKEERMLWQGVWKIPKAHPEAKQLKADAEMYLLDFCGIHFQEVRGAHATFRGGKLTVIHNRRTLKILEDIFDLYRENGCDIQLCEAIKVLPPAAVEKLLSSKKKKNKKKAKK